MNTEHVKKIYSDAEIKQKLGHDYLLIHPGLYDYVSSGNHVRYFLIGSEPKRMRFRSGGFLRGIYSDVSHNGGNDGSNNNVSSSNDDCSHNKYFLLSSSLYDRDSVTWRVYYNCIDQLYKKYSAASYIELYLISASLSEKKRQIEQLIATQARLQAKFDALAADFKLLELKRN